MILLIIGHHNISCTRFRKNVYFIIYLFEYYLVFGILIKSIIIAKCVLSNATRVGRVCDDGEVQNEREKIN